MKPNDLIPSSAQVSTTESHSNSSISASTVARYRQAEWAHEAAKECAIRDLTVNSNLSAQEITTAVMQIQRFHQNAQNCTATIQAMSNPEITDQDATTMKSMRKEGLTDAQIAELFATNQTKVNRMINGN
ncbi:hypothetical protein QE380_000183 [Acinetobacter baylyi]|uniref:Uncharacterized protein n=1 Tax=Acinetobacter baylyi TaxID=202950 RepID=A0ABU0URT4_ACIBI|nr:hypothetical protein [Acinetobacter baylyi]MDQ1207260.1 hypothetical protein [Acinetobacter baylyi]MDR6105658.1 hypothetical protein [Acinetobacter baylyi]MDR6187621.1 hypothetical protein [Acinetobacter baylyi]